jgi:2-(1,2-epoxy-1,2-dihydrophenyl)acetyl-CoA isomerase
MKAFEHFELSRHGHTALVQFRSPRSRNGLTMENIPEWMQLFDVVDAEQDLKFVVLSGVHKTFCLGGSSEFILELLGISFQERVARIASVQGIITRVLRSPLFIVAAVDGLAAGAGAEIVFACDAIFAGAACRISLLYNKLGLVPDCGFLLLGRFVSEHRARQAYVASPVWSQRELVELGIAERSDTLPTSGSEWCQFLGARYRYLVDSFRLTKMGANTALLSRLEHEGPQWANLQAECLETDEVRSRIQRIAALQLAM